MASVTGAGLLLAASRTMTSASSRALRAHVVDRTDWFEIEPDIDDCLTHGLEAGARRYDQHMFYFETRVKATAAAALVLGVACLEAYEMTHDRMYLERAQQTLNFVLSSCARCAGSRDSRAGLRAFR